MATFVTFLLSWASLGQFGLAFTDTRSSERVRAFQFFLENDVQQDPDFSHICFDVV
jgi:hypothetical protein